MFDFESQDVYTKHFDFWIKVQKDVDCKVIDTDSDGYVAVRRGEIFWANLGVNIGNEIDGKGERFTRPVIVLHMIGKKSALVVPLSTKTEKRAGYFDIEIRGQKVSYCVNQIRTISIKRLQERIANLSTGRLQEVKRNVAEFYGF